MAISKANRSHGRQWSLFADQAILGAELEAGAMDAVAMPLDAVIVGGSIIIDEAFDATTTITVSGGGASTGAVDATATGRTALAIDGTTNTLGAAVQVTGSAVSVAGKARLQVEYIRI